MTALDALALCLLVGLAVRYGTLRGRRGIRPPPEVIDFKGRRHGP
jgi:hypothetical protein